MKRAAIYIYFTNGAVKKIERHTRQERDALFLDLEAALSEAAATRAGAFSIEDIGLVVNLGAVCYITKGDIAI